MTTAPVFEPEPADPPDGPQGCHVHVIVDAWQCQADLTDLSAIEALLVSACKAAGATVVGSHFHGFGPGAGVTGVVVLAESHCSIHTWPENGYAAVDVFMCGDRACPQRAAETILKGLRPVDKMVRIIPRDSGALQVASMASSGGKLPKVA